MGSVQKGPLVIGSTLEVALLDEQGEPQGEVFPTTITDDLGQFEVAFTHSGPVSLVGEGFHYNEVTGMVSSAPIGLRALHTIEMAGTQSAYVNVVSHLAERRALEILSGGDVGAAVSQAEQELIAALGIGPPSIDPGAGAIEMNLLGGNSLANAYLFAVGAVMVQAAAIEAGSGGAVDGELQQLLNAVAIDMEDGTIEAPRAQLIADAETALLTDRVEDLLGARLDDLGASSSPPDLDQVVDTDHDDVANDGDTCDWIANPGQQQVLDEVCHARADYSAAPAGVDVAHAGLADLDGDSDVDAAVTDATGQLYLMEGDGSGSFTVAHQQAFGSNEFVLEDVNGDGIVDVVTQSGGGGVDVYPRTATLGALPTAVTSNVETWGLNDFAAGPMDGDAHPELLSAASFSTTGTEDFPLPFTLLINDGSGAFTEGSAAGTLPQGTSFQGPMAKMLADVTGDGLGDVVLAGTSADGSEAVVLTLPGDGSGQLGAIMISTGTLPPGGGMMMSLPSMAFADATGDGTQDVIVAGTGVEAAVLVGNGDGTFGTPVTSSVGIDTSYGSIAATGDFTGDGMADVALSVTSVSDDGLNLAILPSHGGGQLGSAVTRVADLLGPVSFGVALAASDLDGNGADDLLLGLSSSEPASLATMTFTP